MNKAGDLVNGDQKIFFAQLKDGVPFTAGTFMTGKFPFMMFGLPAAALAIYHESKPEKKFLVGGFIDFMLFGVVPNRTRWWLVIPVGLVFAAIYYFGFRFA